MSNIKACSQGYNVANTIQACKWRGIHTVCQRAKRVEVRSQSWNSAWMVFKMPCIVYSTSLWMLLCGSRQIGPRQIGPRHIGPLVDLTANWAPHFLGPNLPFFGKLGPRKLGPLAANWALEKWAPADWAPANWAPVNWALYSYLIFVIFSPPTQFFTKNFSTQKRVNRVKTDLTKTA